MKRAGVLVYGDDLLPSITKRTVACVVIASDASDRTKK
ncbi:MAG: 50S ribosomal protein L7ae, partial [Erysipelothrix sp.]|nr:50S ribosomal protein L7ae [Erysipelothrix sp.]